MRSHAILAVLVLAGAASAPAQEPAQATADDRYSFAAGRSTETAIRLEATAMGARLPLERCPRAGTPRCWASG